MASVLSWPQCVNIISVADCTLLDENCRKCDKKDNSACAACKDDFFVGDEDQRCHGKLRKHTNPTPSVTLKLTGPCTAADKTHIGPVNFLCIIIFTISEIKAKFILGLVKACFLQWLPLRQRDSHLQKVQNPSPFWAPFPTLSKRCMIENSCNDSPYSASKGIWIQFTLLGALLWLANDGFPDSKVYGANMGHTWNWQYPVGPHVGPMNFAIWVLLVLWQAPVRQPWVVWSTLKQFGIFFKL